MRKNPNPNSSGRSPSPPSPSHSSWWPSWPMFGSVKEDRKKTVTFQYSAEEKKDDVSVEVNLDYDYNYENIKAIWTKRLEVVEQWLLDEFKIPRGKLMPVIVPENGIEKDALPGAKNYLPTYLTDHVLNDKNPTYRLVYIPMNTGDHWVTLFLVVDDNNKIASAIYLDSLGGSPLCKVLLKAMKSNKYSLPWSTKELYHQLNEASQHLQRNVIDKLPHDSKLSNLLRIADSSFNLPIERRYHVLQSDNVACGVCSIENAIECVKAAYRGYRHIYRPTMFNNDMMAELRAHHVMLLGLEHPFNAKQLEKRQEVEDSSVRSSRESKNEKRHETLNDIGSAVVTWIRTLEKKHQQKFIDAFETINFGTEELPDYEEHGAQLQRIRDAIIEIKEDLLREGRALNRKRTMMSSKRNKEASSEDDPVTQLEREEQQLSSRRDAFNEILIAISGNGWNLEMIAEIQPKASWSLEIRLKGEFQQLIVIGEALSGKRVSAKPAFGKSVKFGNTGSAQWFKLFSNSYSTPMSTWGSSGNELFGARNIPSAFSNPFATGGASSSTRKSMSSSDSEHKDETRTEQLRFE